MDCFLRKESVTMAKKRVDVLLVEKALVPSRQMAQSLIMAQKIFVGDQVVLKSGQTFPEETDFIVKGKEHPWVSRGGMKLESGLSHFKIDPSHRIAVDIGASTGGFTDVLLHHGAKSVYVVDVGHNQLAFKLRQDPRVIVLEKTNARYLSAEQIPGLFTLIVCDASFISLTKVLPAIMDMAPLNCDMIALIKPQFEAARDQIGKKGVVRDPLVHKEVCDRIAAWLAESGWEVLGLKESPITGPEGNVEFLIWAQKKEQMRHE